MCSTLRLQAKAQTAYARDVVCSGCALNLQGLDLSRNCPRCGMAALESLNGPKEPVSPVNSALDMATGMRNLRIITGYQAIATTALLAQLIALLSSDQTLTSALAPVSPLMTPLCLGLLALLVLLSLITLPATSPLWAAAPAGYRPDYRVSVVKTALIAACVTQAAAALALMAAVLQGKDMFPVIAMPCLAVAVPWGITLGTLSAAYIAQKTAFCMPTPHIQEGTSRAFLLLFAAAGFQLLSAALFLATDLSWVYCASLLFSMLCIAEVFSQSWKVEAALEAIE